MNLSKSALVLGLIGCGGQPSMQDSKSERYEVELVAQSGEDTQPSEYQGDAGVCAEQLQAFAAAVSAQMNLMDKTSCGDYFQEQHAKKHGKSFKREPILSEIKEIDDTRCQAMGRSNAFQAVIAERIYKVECTAETATDPRVIAGLRAKANVLRTLKDRNYFGDTSEIDNVQ